MEAEVAVLFVCTGNICRSPAAERLLARALGPDVRVESAGTRSLVGHPIAPSMARLVEAAGAEAKFFAARTLREPMLQGADLVLTMTDDQVGEVVELWPRSVRRTFTLREFARLLEGVNPEALVGNTAGERLRSGIPLALAQRRPRAERTSDDVVDPYGQPEAVYQDAFRAINEAVDRIVSVISSGAPGLGDVGGGLSEGRTDSHRGHALDARA
jgi:protein-tyrosine phosphatase